MLKLLYGLSDLLNKVPNAQGSDTTEAQ